MVSELAAWRRHTIGLWNAGNSWLLPICLRCSADHCRNLVREPQAEAADRGLPVVADTTDIMCSLF